MFKTVRLQNLCTELNVEDWLLGIADCLRYGKLIIINIGFSYIVWKAKGNKLRYVYAAKALSSDRAKIITKSEFHDFAARFRKLGDRDYLEKSFLANLSGNVFESSGFVPHTLVCAIQTLDIVV